MTVKTDVLERQLGTKGLTGFASMLLVALIFLFFKITKEKDNRITDRDKVNAKQEIIIEQQNIKLDKKDTTIVILFEKLGFKKAMDSLKK